MEFANGKVAGSVYSFGYLVTDEHFHVLVPPTDLLINPECEWNEYVQENILAYSMEEIGQAPTFPSVYGHILSLISSVDFAVGFSIGNDLRALLADCRRYGLTAPSFAWLDVEKLCKKVEAHREAHGLEGCFRAWCQGMPIPENRHRSDVDADMTASLLRAVCESLHVDAEMIRIAYPECTGDSARMEKSNEKKPNHKRHRHHRSPKKEKKENPS